MNASTTRTARNGRPNPRVDEQPVDDAQASPPADRLAALEALSTGIVFKFSDLGALLGLGQRTLEDIAARGEGPTMFRIGRQRYVHRVALHAWLRKLSDEAANDAGSP